MRSASTVPGQCYRYIGKADVQNPVFTFTEGPQVAVSRRLGDETHPWPSNGDLRPLLVIRIQDANGWLWLV
jgi:hypothetical protein